MRREGARWGIVVNALALLGVLLLASCASGTAGRRATATPGAPVVARGGAPAHAPRDYCALVTPSDVRAATDVAVEPPQGHTSVDANIGADADGPRTFTKLAACRYAAVSGPAVVSLNYYYGLPTDVAAVYADRRAKAISPRTVSGLGAAAYWDGTTLGVLNGAVFAQISVQGAPGLAPGSAGLLTAERRIAEIFVTRL